VRVVGCDPSLSGLAVFVDHFGGYEHSVKSCGDRPVDRIHRYTRLVESVCESVFGPANDQTIETVTYIEGYSFGSLASSQLRLAELRAVLYEKLLVGSKIVEVAPATVKMFATGKGNSKKVAVVSELTKRYGITFKTDNLADAFALMKLGMCVEGLEEPQTLQQRKAVDTVKKLRSEA
jgi:crossover junction endodeoxyribonuclease RuvC